MNAPPPPSDEDAFARLYDDTSSLVYGLVLRVVRDPALAEQVTRDVYLHAWAHRQHATVAACGLMATAHRQAVDTARAAETVDPVAACAATSTEPRPAPVTRTSRSARARQALDLLPHDEREAVELAYFGGYTHSQVAALVGAGVGSAQVLIRDGMRQLRTSLLEPA